MAKVKQRKVRSYQQTIVKLDALGDTYHLVCDSWANNYTYECYATLCMFYNVPYCSVLIFDSLIDLLDAKYFDIY